MKMPKQMNRFCKKCKTHTPHKVLMAKRKQASAMSHGSKYRARKKGQARGFGNLGRFSKPAVTNFKMTGKKQTKKTDLRYTCNTCKKTSVQNGGFRAKKIEFV